jgi:ABC-type polysaccharide/polyol phosphate export permease
MSMILAVMEREFRIRTTSMTWLFYDFFLPLTYLLLFGIGLNKAFAGGVVTQGTTVSYNAFFLAGVLSMASFGIAINTAYGFFVDRDNGIFYEFLTYPMTRQEFLIGKILFNCLLSVLQTSVTVSLAAVLLDIPLHWERAALLFAGVVMGTAGWFFFLSTFALRIRRNDMFNALLNIQYFVLMFASSVFYPADAMPDWLAAVVIFNPLTWHTDLLRYATAGIGSAGHIALEGCAFALFTAVTFWLAVRTLTRSILR